MNLFNRRPYLFLIDKEGTNEQREGILQIAKVVNEANKGTLLPGLNNRPAAYPTLLNGSSVNYFSTLRDQKVLKEINDNFSTIQKLL